MSPMYGIVASSLSGHLYSNSYESIATQTVGVGGSATVSFSSIPSTYKHLQIRVLAQTNRATYCRDSLWIRCNSISTASYSDHSLYGDGATAGVGADTSVTNASIGTIGTSAVNSGLMFGARIIDVLDYADTNKYKTIRSIGGVDMNGVGTGSIGGIVDLASGLFQNTSAVSTLTFGPAVGTLFTQGTTFALYGVK